MGVDVNVVLSKVGLDLSTREIFELQALSIVSLRRVIAEILAIELRLAEVKPKEMVFNLKE